MEQITITYRFQDYLDANIIHSKQLLISFKIFGCLMSAIILFSIFLTYISRKQIDWISILFLGFFLVFANYEKTIILSQIKSLFDKQKKYFEQVDFLFTENEVIETTSFSGCKYSWIYQHQITDKMLLIYMNPQGFILIPKKYCSNDKQYENICNLVANLPQGN